MSFPYINAYQQFFDSSGSPLASGTIEFRNPTTNALINSYPTADDADAQTNENANPLTLNASGAAASGLFLEDGVTYKVILKDVDGNTVATHDDVACPVNVGAATTAEAAASVTPTNPEYAEGDVRRYGAVLDGSTDDSSAWSSADSVATNGGPPIFVPRSSSGMAIESGVSTANDVHFEEGAFLLYTGSTEEAALTLGVVTGNTSKKTYRNLTVRRDTQADWTDEDNIGIRCLNLIACNVEAFEADGFTIGVQVEGNDYGCAYNKYHLGTITDNKIGLLVTNADTSLTQGYCNENIFYGGRFSVFTGVNSTLARWGIKIDSERATKSFPNNNKFYGPSIELNATDASANARAILINYGYYNTFHECRDEGNDQPFMECENESEWNIAKLTGVNVGSVVQNDGDYDNNFVENTRESVFNRQNSSWHSGPLHRIANEYDGAGAVYIPGCSQRNSSNGNQSPAIGATTVADEYVDIPSSRGIGVMVETENIKRFVFRRDVVSGRGGRIIVIPYDTSAAQLTTDGGYVRATAAATMTHTSNAGGAYQTGADSDNDFFFSVSSDVFFIWVGYFGGTASARVKSFGLESIDGGALTVFQGYTDLNSDPFPNDLQNYATAAPATATAGPNYPAGKRITLFNASAGGSPGWICTTQGLGGTAVFKAEANVAA